MVNPFTGACGSVGSGCPAGEFTYVIAARVALSDFRARLWASDTPNAWPSIFPKRPGPRLTESLLNSPKDYRKHACGPGLCCNPYSAVCRARYMRIEPQDFTRK